MSDVKQLEITATVVLKLNVPIDQPLMDWLPDAIQEQLEEGEEILSYTDTQPDATFAVTVKGDSHVG
jgi:hypothetical protein